VCGSAVGLAGFARGEHKIVWRLFKTTPIMIDAIAMAIRANARMLFPFVAGADGRSLKG